jgi:pimeloyl-ACP methyl ester carboxylesterase
MLAGQPLRGELTPMAKQAEVSPNTEPLIIAEQGSFLVGGRTVKAAGSFDQNRLFVPFQSTGQTFSIEHLYAQFQIPPDARKLPLVMVHGGCQTGKTWDTTADGREGFQTLFVRRGFAVYVIDYPGRGRSGIRPSAGAWATSKGPDHPRRHG